MIRNPFVSFVLSLILAIALTSCASIGLQTQAQKVEATCATASAALKVATAANVAGKLSASQQAVVSHAVAIIWPDPPAAPVCNAPSAPTLTQLEYQALIAAAGSLVITGAPAH